MENPADWSPAEKVIHRALREHQEVMQAGLVGASNVATIARALREAGLLKE